MRIAIILSGRRRPTSRDNFNFPTRRHFENTCCRVGILRYNVNMAANRTSKPIDATNFQEAAECLHTLAHPVRLRMVQLILRKELTVGELAEACEIPSHMASEHLRMMQHCGLLMRLAGRATDLLSGGRAYAPAAHGLHRKPLWGGKVFDRLLERDKMSPHERSIGRRKGRADGRVRKNR